MISSKSEQSMAAHVGGGLSVASAQFDGNVRRRTEALQLHSQHGVVVTTDVMHVDAVARLQLRRVCCDITCARCGIADRELCGDGQTVADDD